ncbi:carboxylate--amine ligase [Priestia abyssalis]|uniref:carboxylate--amine ligase n=1 Tax=Priestia abyssalis TaxID=1221450 RepID=UPI000994B21A|nr:ATP-grasp domain-containing protein [Priestia abyssalis]
MTVFITDGLHRKSLAAVRSLGKKGISVTVGEKTRWNSSAFSKFCRRSFIYPDPEQAPDRFAEWFDTHVEKQRWDVFLPMDDAAVEIALHNRKKWETKCRLVLPPSESYWKARDKYEAVQLAEKAGLAVPGTYIPQSLEELRVKMIDLAFPVIIKPRKSSGSRGIQVVEQGKDLLEAYKRAALQYERPMIQEYIPQGDRFDVCLLFDQHHEMKSAFVQREIRHFPIPMGPSTVQESVIHDELVEQSLRFMSKLPWYGVIELEFMIDPRDGTAKFMEANPRFWNSLQCAIQAGIDFPYMLYELAVRGDVQKQCWYKEGIRCRNVLPGDVLHYVTNPDRFRMHPSFFSGKAKNVYDDILSVSDPLPALGFFLACLRYSLQKEMWKKMFKRHL